MMLPSPGLLLNSKPFDSMLAFFKPSNGLALYPLDKEPVYLVQPNMSTFNAVSARASFTESDAAVIQSLSSSPESLLSDQDPDYKPRLYMTLSELRTMKPESTFNATAFFEATAFIKVHDPILPGPEFDIPYENIVKNRPDDVDQAFIWERMYSLYKSRRYTVCGLDPKPWPQTESNSTVSNETKDTKQDLL
jgi:hypothetical protein